MAEIDDLLNQLRNGLSGDPDAEWKAAIALGEVQTVEEKARAVSGLTEILASGTAHALTRSHAVEALGKLGDQQALSALTTALRDPYRLVRAYSAGALGSIGNSEELVNTLLDLAAQDEFYGVRAEAVEAATAIAVRIGDAALRTRVRNTLIARRAAEQVSQAVGTIRVIAEIDRALVRLSS